MSEDMESIVYYAAKKKNLNFNPTNQPRRNDDGRRNDQRRPNDGNGRNDGRRLTDFPILFIPVYRRYLME